MKRVRTNAFFSAVEVLVNGVGMFLLVIVLYRHVGAAGIGVWSLVMAIANLVRIADLGIAPGIARFVALWGAGGETADPGRVVAAAAIVTAAAHGALALVAYLPAAWALRMLIAPDRLPAALELLPWALLSVSLVSVSSLVISVVVGLHRSDLRSVVAVAGGIVLVGGTALLLPVMGLLGAVVAQIGQGLVMSVGLWLMVRREAPAVASVLGRPAFGVVLGLVRSNGVPVQGAFLATLTIEPTTKAFLAAIGPIEAVGYFEMAHRVVQQARSVAAAPNLSLVSAFADFDHRDKVGLRILFRRALDLTLLIGPLVLGAAVAGAPFLAQVWTGYAAPLFVAYLVVLSAGAAVGLVSLPAYSFATGLGEHRWAFAGQVTVALLNVALGAALGLAFGSVGTVAGLAIATAVGSLVLVAPVRRRTAVRVREVLVGPGGVVVAGACAGAVAGILGYWTIQPSVGTLAAGAASGLLFLLCAIVPTVRHPIFGKTVVGLRGRVYLD